MMSKKYSSAIDVWHVIVLVGTPLLIGGLGVLALTKSIVAGVIQIGIGVVVGVALAMLAVPCYYTLDDKSLKIKSGLMEEDIALEKIKGVEKSGSLCSAPALSLKRVKIILDDGFRLVSPKDRDGFIEALQQRIEK